MKKLIAISVVFALVAGAAFAADIGAEVIGMTDIIKGSTAKSYYSDGSDKPSSVDAGGWPGGLKRVRVSASGEDDNSLFGGWFRFEKYGMDNPGLAGYAWWKPIEQVKFTLGTNPDGFFGLDGMTRWNFYQVGGDVGVPKENWKLSQSFYGGWGENGGLLTITPMEALEINVGIPYSQGGKAQDVYMRSTIQVAYTADGLGKFGLTYIGGVNREEGKAVDGFVEQYWFDGEDATFKVDEDTGDIIPVPAKPAGFKYKWNKGDSISYIHDPSKIMLYVGLTMIENLGIDFGFGYTLPMSGKGIKAELPLNGADGKAIKVEFAEGTYNAPMAVGLGVKFDAGDFGVKARMQGLLAGKIAVKDADAVNIPLNVVFDVMPYYAISESLTGHFSLGVDYTAKQDKADDDYAKMGFHATPYLTIKSNWWAPNLYVGIDIRTDGFKFKDGGESKDGATAMNWSVPIGIAFGF
jgi:opacity protein-like surface antigen